MPPALPERGGVSEREFAALEVEVRHLRESIERSEDAVRELAERVTQLQATLQTVRGGWLVLAGMGGVLMTIGGLIVGLIRATR